MIKEGAQETVIRIPTNGTSIEGNLTIPYKAKSIVIFAHGSGSSRFSPRNTHVAKVINANLFPNKLHMMVLRVFHLLTSHMPSRID